MTSEKKEERKDNNTKLKTIKLISKYSISQNEIRAMMNLILLPELTTIVENYSRTCIWKEDIDLYKPYNYHRIYFDMYGYYGDQLTANSEDYISHHSLPNMNIDLSKGRKVRFASIVRDHIQYEYNNTTKLWGSYLYKIDRMHAERILLD